MENSKSVKSAESAKQCIQAVYSSQIPQKEFILSAPISTPAPSSNTKAGDDDATIAKYEHFASLRAAAAKLQDDVNVLLTKAMEEDKKLEGSKADANEKELKGKSKKRKEELGGEGCEEDEDMDGNEGEDFKENNAQE